MTRKDGSPGIDGVTAGDCEATMPEADLLDLFERVKCGGYRVPPVCRAYFPNVDVIISRDSAGCGRTGCDSRRAIEDPVVH